LAFFLSRWQLAARREKSLQGKSGNRKSPSTPSHLRTYWLHMAHLYWSFFEMIDEELHSFSQYVDFSEANFPTYSVYLARLYVSICSEIDVVAKLLCKRIKPDTKAGNIQDYHLVIAKHYYLLPKLKITILPIPLELMPWEIWQDKDITKNPDWWQSHQNVKHHRDEFFKEANLGNVLKSAAGLLVLLTYWNCNEVIHCELSINFRVLEIDQRHIPKYGSTVRNVVLPDIYPLGAIKIR
jgi:hypothetical protein